MKFKISKISYDEWEKYLARDSYLISFGVHRNPSLDRIDFALLAADDENKLSGFITCKEMDAETVYFQYGGSMPNYEKTLNVFSGYMSFVHWTKERYKRITTRIENTNLPMLKLAMKAGFLVIGSFNFNGKIFLELIREEK